MKLSRQPRGPTNDPKTGLQSYSAENKLVLHVQHFEKNVLHITGIPSNNSSTQSHANKQNKQTNKQKIKVGQVTSDLILFEYA